jgi:hypothetical protein
LPINPLHFFDESIEVAFKTPPAYEKTPPCPDSFIWRGEVFGVVELLEEWHDFARRGRMGRNMRPDHAARASLRGSWGVGRFHYRVQVENGRVFQLYYDRAPKDAGGRKGRWFLYCEWG